MTPLHSAALFGRQRALLRVDLDVGSIVPPKDCVQQGRAPRFEEIMGFSVRPCTSILRELRELIYARAVYLRAAPAVYVYLARAASCYMHEPCTCELHVLYT